MRWTIISGTNRQDSMTLRFSHFVESELKKRCSADEVAIINLLKLPKEIFDPQVYAEKPESFAPFQKQISDSDAIISVLPEYNGSAPGVYKYFIDMLSFPESLRGLPCWFCGISAGRFGSLRSVEHMQQVFEYRNALVFPEYILIPQVENNFSEDKGITDEFQNKLFNESLDHFISFARKLRS